MRLKNLKLAVFASITFVAASSLSAHAAGIVLKASHNANQDEPYHTGMMRMSELLKEKTDGKAEIKVYANAQLGDEMESIQGTQLGLVDIAVTANEVFANFVPLMQVFSLPYLFEGPAHLDRVARSDAVHDYIDTALAAKGYRLVGLFFAGTRNIMSKKPINSMEDLSGRKIRTLNNPIHIDSFKSFGANPTPMAYTELYGALETGVVDGAEAANTNYHSQKFYEVAPNWAMVGWIELVAPVVMSTSKFDSLPKDVQTALLAAGKEAAQEERKTYEQSDNSRLETLKKLKVNITHPNVAPFRAAAEKVYGSHIKSDEQKKLLQLIRDTK